MEVNKKELQRRVAGCTVFSQYSILLWNTGTQVLDIREGER